MTRKYVQTHKHYLKATISSTATSITLTFLQKMGGASSLSMTDYGDLGIATIDPTSASKAENISFTGITANANGTYTLTGVTRGLKGVDDYATGGNQVAHSGGATLVFSNSAVFYDQFGNIYNAQTWALKQSFTVVPESAADATGGNDLVRYSQLQSALLGTLLSAPLVMPGNGGEDLVVDQLVFLNRADSEWYKADADTAAEVENVMLGITRGAGTDGAAIASGITILGKHTFSTAALTANNIYYASNTAGGVSTTPGTNEVTLGIAISTTVMNFMPRFDQQITEDQQDAMVGKSGTTPSGSNLFIDEDYTAEAKTASKIPVRDANGDVLVTTTPTAGDAATSKTFVEAADAAVLAVVASKEYGVNTETADTYWTYTVPGITTFATSNNTVVDFNSYSRHTSSGAAYSTMGIMGNGSGSTYTAASGKELRVKFRVKFDGDEARLAVGLVQSNSAIHAVRTSVADGIRLIADSGVFYFSSANGTTNENTDIDSGLTDTNWNTVEFIFDPTVDAEIWVNGTLEGTHSTYLPVGALMFAIGQETGSGIIQISPITFSVEN